MVDAAGEDFEHGVDGVGRGNAQAADEAALDAAIGEVAGHLLAAAVDHGDLVAGGAGGGDLARKAVAGIGGIEQGAAELHEELHSSASVSA